MGDVSSTLQHGEIGEGSQRNVTSTGTIPDEAPSDEHTRSSR